MKLPAVAPFQIRKLEAFHLVVPDVAYWNEYRPQNRAATDRFVLKPGWRTVYGKRMETALVKVTLEDGSIGWGEATEPICPEVICHLAAALMAPLLVGQSFEGPRDVWDFCYDLNRGRGHVAGYHLLAMAAIDIALWDALARRENKPLCQLLNPNSHGSVPIYLSGIRKATRAERIEALQGHAAKGLRAAKIFVGADIDDTADEIAALRQAVGSDFDLMVDALWSFNSPEEANLLRRKLEPYAVTWLECPLIPEDVEGHRALQKEPGIPIAFGETFFTIHQLEAFLKPAALQVFQPDMGRTGLSVGLEMTSLATSQGVVTTPHMGAGSAVVQAAALQFWAAGCGKLPCEYQLDLAPACPDVFNSAWTYAGGSFRTPAAIGHGVEVDEAALRPHCAACESFPAS